MRINFLGFYRSLTFHSIYIILVVAFRFLLTPSFARCEDQDLEQTLESYTEERYEGGDLKDLSKLKDPKIREMVAEAERKFSLSSQAVKAKYSKGEEKSVPNTIVLHLRGNSGVKLLQESPDDNNNPFSSLLQGVIQQSSKEFESNIELPKLNFPTFPHCISNKTERERVDTDIRVKPEAAKLPISDILFIDAKDVPSEKEEIFGRLTTVVPLSGESDDPFGGIAQSFEVPCIPYRIRATMHYIFRDQGLNALRNFGDNYLGEGHFHRYIQEKYGVKDVKG